MGFGVVLGGLMVVFYVLPYQQAIGGVATGEWVTALFTGMSVVLTGWLARRGAIKTYGN
jgi:hypothetical protein